MSTAGEMNASGVNAAAAPVGWPFLVARGRRRGYSTLLAPGWLIAERGHGLIEELVGPVDGRPYRSATAVSPQGRLLNVVWAEHLVTAADVASTSAPRDEHSRPLRLLYGFLCTATIVVDPAGDLTHSRLAALDTYRHFLADEEHFAVEASAPFEVAADVAAGTAPATHAVRETAWVAAREVLPASRAATGGIQPPRSRLAGLAVAGVLIAAFVAAGAIWLSGGTGEAPPPCPPGSSSAHASVQPSAAQPSSPGQPSSARPAPTVTGASRCG